MDNRNEPEDIGDVVDGSLAGPELDAWLLAHPGEADEVLMARRVRTLLRQMQSASINVPSDFESRLLERVRTDRTALDLIDLSLSGVGQALLELIMLLLGLTGGARQAPVPAV